MGPNDDRAGVMVIRVWIEQSDRSLRARLTHTLNLANPHQTSQAVAGREDIIASVQAWIEAFAGDAADL